MRSATQALHTTLGGLARAGVPGAGPGYAARVPCQERTGLYAFSTGVQPLLHIINLLPSRCPEAPPSKFLTSHHGPVSYARNTINSPAAIANEPKLAQQGFLYLYTDVAPHGLGAKNSAENPQPRRRHSLPTRYHSAWATLQSLVQLVMPYRWAV